MKNASYINTDNKQDSNSQLLFEKVAISCDHAAIELKELIINHESLKKYQWIDFGCFESNTKVDYPHYALQVVKAVTSKQADMGICLCGTGIGMSMAANRHTGIRAAVVWNMSTAKASRKHNDANILCMGARQLDHELACKLANIWLGTKFDGGRHAKRIAMFDQC